MARNEEKAQSLLNRWTSMKQGFSDTFKKCVLLCVLSVCWWTHSSLGSRRPYLASQCDNLKDAERWRRQIIREISKKISDIQNGELPHASTYIWSPNRLRERLALQPARVST